MTLRVPRYISVAGLDIGYICARWAACLFEAVGPVRATTIYFPLARGASVFFFSASYAAIIFTGNRQNSEGNVNSLSFFVIYMPNNVQKCATSRVKS